MVKPPCRFAIPSTAFLIGLACVVLVPKGAVCRAQNADSGEFLEQTRGQEHSPDQQESFSVVDVPATDALAQRDGALQNDGVVPDRSVRKLMDALGEHYVTLQHGVEATYVEDYARAESLFALVSWSVPEHPAGPLMMASAVIVAMTDREVYERESDFRALLDSSEVLAKAWIEKHDDDPWGHCFLGHVYGYRGMWEGRFGSWFKALKLGLKARGAYNDALKRDSTCWDAYVGLGSYHYWKSAKTEFINWMGLFVKDEKDRGLQEMATAMERGLLTRAAAAAGLIWMHLHRGSYGEAAELAAVWWQAYPTCKTFLWGQAYAEFYARANDVALHHFDILRSRVAADPRQSLFNLVEIDYHRAYLHQWLNNPERACAIMDSVLRLPLDEDVRKRQKDRLKDARKFIQAQCGDS